MSEEMYANALKTALLEIRNVCPDINHAFILTDNGAIVAGDEQPIDSSIEKAVGSLQDLTEKAASIGGISDFVIDDEKGKVYVSQVNGMYSVMSLSKRADLPFLRTITNIILPTVLKVLHSIDSEASLSTPLKSTPIVPHAELKLAPSAPKLKEEIIEESIEEPTVEEDNEKPESLKIEAETDEAQEAEEAETAASEVTELPSQQFIVDKFGGLMVRSDSVQVDFEILDRWASMLNVKEIRELDVETFKGKTTRCKAKVISDEKLQGRGIIRIPEKTCDALELKRGELVRVKPVIQEE
jgi:predicted regulator of Ras-like GTPase activity (Roadblock/LC7/MglB family)